MKCLRTMVLFDCGELAASSDWKQIYSSYERAIELVDFPEGSGRLTLRRKVKREDGQWDRNGVNYLKKRFADHMVSSEGWVSEARLGLKQHAKSPELRLYPSGEIYQEPITSDFGGFDLSTSTHGGLKAAIEWETGNISSSHRSLNKLAISLATEVVDIGVLIVPNREMYEHLTDRIGNIAELAGYLSMWASLGASVKRGMLVISVVGHDELTSSEDHPYLPSGNDGRAKEGKAKKW